MTYKYTSEDPKTLYRYLILLENEYNSIQDENEKRRIMENIEEIEEKLDNSSKVK